MFLKVLILVLFLPPAGNSFGQYFNVQKFGAKGNGVVDDTKAINRAIASARAWTLTHPNKMATIFFPATKKNYLINSIAKSNSHKAKNIKESRIRNFIFPVFSNMIFTGSETGVATIRFANHLFDSASGGNIELGTGEFRNANLFYAKSDDSISNVFFKKLTIDFNGANNLLAPGQDKPEKNATGELKTIYGIILEGGCHDVTIEELTFKNNPGRNDIIAIAPGYNLTIQKCNFKNGGANVGSLSSTNKYANDFSSIYSEWDHSRIENNTIEQAYPELSLGEGSFAGGIEIHGSFTKMDNNKIYGCKPAVYVSSATSLSADFSLDNKPLKDIVISNNQMIDCYNGIIFWAKNPINNVQIDNNKITLMYFKESDKIKIIPSKNKLIAGVSYVGGNLKCKSEYEYRNCSSCFNYNLNSISQLTITQNSISFSLSSLLDSSLITTGILLHSVHNSKIANNKISRMNWSGISLQGSRWGTNNLTIENNTISDFEYSYQPESVSGFIVVTDTYLPNSNCGDRDEKTFSNIDITGNLFLANNVSENEAACNRKNYACFRPLYFDLPSWYAYQAVPSNPYTANSFKRGIISIKKNSHLLNNSAKELKAFFITGACEQFFCK